MSKTDSTTLSKLVRRFFGPKLSYREMDDLEETIGNLEYNLDAFRAEYERNLPLHSRIIGNVIHFLDRISPLLYISIGGIVVAIAADIPLLQVLPLVLEKLTSLLTF